MNVTLFGKRVIADAINDLEMRSSWITRMGPKSNDKYPFRDRREDKREWEEKPCEDGGQGLGS